MGEMSFSMGEGRELEQLHIIELASSLTAKDAAFTEQQPSSRPKNWRWWLLLILYIILILTGQTAGTLLGRFYYEQGGTSLWMTTLLPSAGFPLLIPLLLLLPSTSRRRPSSAKLAAVCTILGLLIAGDNLMYSYGLRYLPVSTFSLLCATQLAFNAVFAYFLNSQNFTPYIFNSVILLTIAAVLLSINSEGGSASSNNYPLGITLTLVASGVCGLLLSLTQLSVQKVLKAETMASVLEMILWTGLVSSLASVVGLFASGQWKGIHEEFVGFKSGRFSYVMALLWNAVSFTVASVGSIGLIFTISSLFANVIGTLGLPLVPIMAVVFFHEKMEGVKVVALMIAILGFANYMYQHYLDDLKQKNASRNAERPVGN